MSTVVTSSITMGNVNVITEEVQERLFAFDAVCDNAVKTSESMGKSLIYQKDIDAILEASKGKKEVYAKSGKGYAPYNADLQDYFMKAYNTVNTVGKNAEWAKREVIALTMDNDSFKAAFVTDKEYADFIGESTAKLSKMRRSPAVRDKLIEITGLEGWSVSFVDEILSKYDKMNFKDDSIFRVFITECDIAPTMTIKAVREAFEHYTNVVNGEERPNKSKLFVDSKGEFVLSNAEYWSAEEQAKRKAQEEQKAAEQEEQKAAEQEEQKAAEQEEQKAPEQSQEEQKAPEQSQEEQKAAEQEEQKAPEQSQEAQEAQKAAEKREKAIDAVYNNTKSIEIKFSKRKGGNAKCVVANDDILKVIEFMYDNGMIKLD